ncbi:MAG: N-acetyltransferase [Mediterranea sp.]|jgi:predicted GNAT family acetyltransferase|nr:N-acetyltransferase [Mediterranea sp.]
MAEEYTLVDNKEKKRYEFDVDGQLAIIEYILQGNEVIIFTHTEVPVKLGGRGIGTRLVAKVLEDAERRQLKVVPLCPFVAAYMLKHPEWKRVLMAGFHLR